MEYEFAPLEGITDAVYRRTHRRYYPGVTRYYTPFISPTQNHCFTPREKRELSPGNNPGVPLIPQLLGKNAQDFLWAANELCAMGYEEVNLNLGCPSRTVTAKSKGAGFLSYPDVLDAFLEEIFSACPISISIKTRLGMESPSEFDRLLTIYNRYPVCRLIIHPRTGRQLYGGSADFNAYRRAVSRTALPLVYNGDLFTPRDVQGLRASCPEIGAVMLGRGLICDPALTGKLQGYATDKGILKRFHDDLCREYPVVFGDKSSAAHRIKAIWAYMLCSFQDGSSYRKKLIKANRLEDLLIVTEEIFQQLELLPEAEFVPP